EAHTPREGVAAAARHPAGDERVQNLTLGLAQPRHHGRRDMGEQRPLATALHAPGNLLAEPVLRLARHLDAVLAGALAELLDPGPDGRVPLGGGCLVSEPRLRDTADDGDLLAVDGDLDQLLEQVVGQTAGEPAAQLFSLLRRNHVMTITPVSHKSKSGRGAFA